jgi:hypothetical protein
VRDGRLHFYAIAIARPSHEEERALLVRPQPAVLAEAREVSAVEVGGDVAIPPDAELVGPILARKRRSSSTLALASRAR